MKNPVRSLLLGLLFGTMVNLVFLLIEFLNAGQVVFSTALMKEAGYTYIYAVVLTYVNKGFFEYLGYLKIWKKYSRYRILIGAVGSITLTMLGIFIIRMFIEMTLEGVEWEAFIAGEQAAFYIVALLITVVISVFFHAVHFYKHWQENKVKEQKIIAGTASAKFDALKNQLDPHFLFNSLNVLTSLIEEDPSQAQKFTTSLSKVYRYVLEQKNKDLVTVDEELQFARTYVQLLKMRFEDSIIFEIPELAGNPDARIVPLSLQLLLENAVKHNMVTASRPLNIRVFEADGMLVISNNLQEKQVVKKGSGVGLHNIRQRYSILSNRNVEINKTAASFEVRLPMLTRQILPMETPADFIEDKRYQKAKERVEAIKGFYGNLGAYCLVIPFLAYLNYRTTSFPWVIFPTLGWGFGLLMHGLEAYGYNPLWGKRWEERKIRELMEKEDF
jgi:hypothetical protein